MEIEAGLFPIVISGNLFRIAQIKDEPWLADSIADPSKIISELNKIRPAPDIFIFSQRLPDMEPRFNFYFEYDNLAAIPISTYDDWWRNQLKPATRNMVRKAERAGITTRAIEYDDALVNGISAIYNETPVRQGRKFWHYRKDVPTVRKENATYLDRATFIGAFLNDELVGFLKMIHVGQHAKVMQILSFVRHRDKAVTNALLAKAVEVCSSKKLTHLVYANFSYGNKGEDSLSGFKRRNAFIRIDIPKYFVPLTMKGRVALALKLHRSPTELLPRWLIVTLLATRKRWLSLFASHREAA
ncbi:MAG: hypothetical protein HC869_05590 [Rhodospirillales bacterium]|nr:hypothetical protein [Rhodospirillales bacterium]